MLLHTWLILFTSLQRSGMETAEFLSFACIELEEVIVVTFVITFNL